MTDTIGSVLRARREALGLDKGRAASRIGMSRTSYGAYERDAQRPSIEVFAPLIEFLDIPLEDFLVLYGATCVAIARASFSEPTSASGSVAIGAQDERVESSIEEESGGESGSEDADARGGGAPDAGVSVGESPLGADDRVIGESFASVEHGASEPSPASDGSKTPSAGVHWEKKSKKSRKSKKNKHKRRH